MTCLTKLAAVSVVSIGLLSLASCNTDKVANANPPPPAAKSDGTAGSTIVSMTPGEAGGVIQDSFTASAHVSAVDSSSREITLAADDGTKTTFVAGPEVRNFDQIRVGDTVSATITERLNVFVRGDDVDPTVTHAAVLATAPKCAKPGATLAQSYEVVAKVSAIDAANRTADRTFSNGQTKTIPVRSDVELSRYKVGDSVVIRVTEVLSVLVKSS